MNYETECNGKIKAICIKEVKYTDSIKVGKEYEVIKLYTCSYSDIERVIIQCEDGQRDCYAENFLIKV